MLDLIIKVAEALYEQVDTAKHNKAQSALLKKRVEAIVDTLKKTQQIYHDDLKSPLQRLKEWLQTAIKTIEPFSKKFHMNFLRAKKNAEQFTNLNQQLIQIMAELNAALNVVGLKNQAADSKALENVRINIEALSSERVYLQALQQDLASFVTLEQLLKDLHSPHDESPRHDEMATKLRELLEKNESLLTHLKNDRNHRRIGFSVQKFLLFLLFLAGTTLLIRLIRPEDTEVQRSDFPTPTWNLPSEDLFLERPKLREDITKQLMPMPMGYANTVPATTTVLYGIRPGVGTTALAEHIINRPPYSYNFRAWMRADSRGKLLTDYQSMAQDLGWVSRSQSMSEQEIIELIHHQLAQIPKPGWLIVFSRANNVTMLKNLLPKHGGQRLLTSTSDTWKISGVKSGVKIVEVPPFDEKEAIELLSRLLGKAIHPEEIEYSEAQKLVEELGYLPSNITQIAKLLSTQQKSITEYRQEIDDFLAFRQSLNKTGPRLLGSEDQWKKASPTEIARWHVALDALKNKVETIPVYSHAENLLRLCAYLHPNELPEKLLKRWLAKQMSPSNNEEVSIKSQLRILIDGLVNHGLLNQRAGQQTLSIHEPLQIILREEHRDALSNDEQLHYWKETLALFLEEFTEESYDKDRLIYRLQLTEHFNQLLERIDMSENTRETLPKVQLAKAIYHSGLVYYQTMQFLKAGDYWQQALEILISSHREHRDDLLIEIEVLIALSQVSEKLGTPQKMPIYLEEVLDSLQQIPEQTDTLFKQKNIIELGVSFDLALALKNSKDFEQSQKYFKRALEISRTVFEREPLTYLTYILFRQDGMLPDEVTLLFHLAQISKELKDFKQARLYLRQIQHTPGIHSIDNICTNDIIAWVNLKKLSQEIGDLEQADKYFERIMSIRSHRYDSCLPVRGLTIPTSTSFLRTLNPMLQELVQASQDNGNLEQAKESFEHILARGISFYRRGSHKALLVTPEGLSIPKDMEIAELLPILHTLESILQELGDPEQAAWYQEKISAIEPITSKKPTPHAEQPVNHIFFASAAALISAGSIALFRRPPQICRRLIQQPEAEKQEATDDPEQNTSSRLEL